MGITPTDKMTAVHIKYGISKYGHPDIIEISNTKFEDILQTLTELEITHTIREDKKEFTDYDIAVWIYIEMY